MNGPAAAAQGGPSVVATAWDAVVVGAGPAGAIAAFDLARAGARVLLVDRAAFPRWKVCGCCLNPRGMAALRGAGLEQRIRALGPRSQARFRLAAGGVEAALSLPGAVSLSRERLDAALVEAAVEAGASWLPGRRARLLDGPRPIDGYLIELAGSSGEPNLLVRATIVIAADGLGGALAVDRLGGEELGPVARIGAGTLLDAGAAVDWDDEAVNMVVGRHGYVGFVRLEDGRWNAAAALDAEATRQHGDIASVVSGILSDAGWSVPRALVDAPWRGTPRLWRRPRRVAAERLFAVGDAGGYVEPFTGEGMAWALSAGRAVVPIALRAIARWDPALAEEWTLVSRDGVQRGQALSRSAARLLRYPVLATWVTAVLGAWPGLAGPALGRLNAVAPGSGEGESA